MFTRVRFFLCDKRRNLVEVEEWSDFLPRAGSFVANPGLEAAIPLGLQQKRMQQRRGGSFRAFHTFKIAPC